MTVNAADLDRMCGELLDPDFDGAIWAEKENLSDDLIVFLVDSATEGFKGLLLEKDVTPELALKSTFANVFRMGWEAHKQFGKVGTSLE